jgi:hypothetical protein
MSVSFEQLNLSRYRESCDKIKRGGGRKLTNFYPRQTPSPLWAPNFHLRASYLSCLYPKFSLQGCYVVYTKRVAPSYALFSFSHHCDLDPVFFRCLGPEPSKLFAIMLWRGVLWYYLQYYCLWRLWYGDEQHQAVRSQVIMSIMEERHGTSQAAGRPSAESRSMKQVMRMIWSFTRKCASGQTVSWTLTSVLEELY